MSHEIQGKSRDTNTPIPLAMDRVGPLSGSLLSNGITPPSTGDLNTKWALDGALVVSGFAAAITTASKEGVATGTHDSWSLLTTLRAQGGMVSQDWCNGRALERVELVGVLETWRQSAVLWSECEMVSSL